MEARQDRSSGAARGERGRQVTSPERARQKGSQRRVPLVYATTLALEQARPLLPLDVCLERAVAEAIAEGHVDASQQGGFVFLDELDVVVRCVREPGKFRPRPRAWTVVAVARRRRRR